MPAARPGERDRDDLADAHPRISLERALALPLWGMDVEKAIRTRRTHKAFTPEAMEPAVLDELFELASWAPNHHLTSPWRFRVLGASARASG